MESLVKKEVCKNKYLEKENYIIIYTYKNEQIFIDKEDFDLVKNYTWHTALGYARSYIKIETKYKQYLMHKIIMNNNEDIFHINGNKLDNRKSNLKNLYTNEYIIKDKVVIITTNKNEEILIDIEDLELIKKYNWHITKRRNTYYAITNIDKKIILMHRLLFQDIKNNELIDHINRNGLDNRKINLRIANHQQNSFNSEAPCTNTSGYKCITITKFKTYCVRIKVNQKNIHIGNFKTIEEAINKYNEAIKKYAGDFAYINIVESKKNE